MKERTEKITRLSHRNQLTPSKLPIAIHWEITISEIVVSDYTVTQNLGSNVYAGIGQVTGFNSPSPTQD